MPYNINFKVSARRHLEAANNLKPPNSHRRDIAGYLYGLAAEMAVKAIMLDSEMRRLINEIPTDNPFFAHFPDLKTLVRDVASGRRRAMAGSW